MIRNSENKKNGKREEIEIQIVDDENPDYFWNPRKNEESKSRKRRKASKKVSSPQIQEIEITN